MDNWLTILFTGFISIVTSSGFWAYMQKKSTRNTYETKMLLGLGHDRIVELCLKYIDRGWIYEEEYENLVKYLYEPYTELGGNGTAKRLVTHDVARLPIKPHTYQVMEEP